MEKETGQRVDANDGDNMAMAGLIGAIAREMGITPKGYTEKDDVAAGVLLKHRSSREYQQELQGREMIANLLLSGVSPDALKGISDALGENGK